MQTTPSLSGGRRQKIGNIYFNQAKSMAKDCPKLDSEIYIAPEFDEDRSIVTVGHKTFIHADTKITKILKLIDDYRNGKYKSELTFSSDLNKVGTIIFEDNEVRSEVEKNVKLYR